MTTISEFCMIELIKNTKMRQQESYRMKVILVNGSPHKHGSTHAALQVAEQVLQEHGIDTEMYWMGNQAIVGCTGCGQCRQLKKCTFEDVVNEFRPKIEEADGFVFGTPVHYAAASGAFTSFMDRLFYSEGGRNGGADLRLKPVANLAIARRGGISATLDQMNKYPTISEMPLVSSSYWNMVHGASAEDIAVDEEGVHTVQVLARNLIYQLQCIEAGRAAGVERPEKARKPWTNFVR